LELSGGGRISEKILKIVQKPNSMPNDLAKFAIKNYKLSTLLTSRLKDSGFKRGSGKSAVDGDFRSALSSVARKGVSRLIKYIMENPDQFVKFIQQVIKLVRKNSSAEMTQSDPIEMPESTIKMGSGIASKLIKDVKARNLLKKYPMLGRFTVHDTLRKLDSKTVEGGGISDIFGLFKKGLQEGAKRLVQWVIENPQDALRLLMKIHDFIQENLPEEQKEEFSEETSGAGLWSDVKSLTKKTGKAFHEAGKSFVKKPSKHLSLAGNVLGLVSLAAPELAPVATGLKVSSRALEMAGKGKKTKRPLNQYQLHVKKERLAGKSLKEAAVSWRAIKTGAA
jgi:hypothetical protein